MSDAEGFEGSVGDDSGAVVDSVSMDPRAGEVSPPDSDASEPAAVDDSESSETARLVQILDEAAGGSAEKPDAEIELPEGVSPDASKRFQELANTKRELQTQMEQIAGHNRQLQELG